MSVPAWTFHTVEWGLTGEMDGVRKRCAPLTIEAGDGAAKRMELEHPNQTFTPGPSPGTVQAAAGRTLTVPDGWELLPPGDAALTRRVKAAGDSWVIQEKKGRKVFSRGVWAPAGTIARVRADLAAERSTEEYARRKQTDAHRRDRAQAEYAEKFFRAVVSFLAFHPRSGSASRSHTRTSLTLSCCISPAGPRDGVPQPLAPQSPGADGDLPSPGLAAPHGLSLQGVVWGV